MWELDQYDRVTNAINELSENQKLTLWNEYQDSSNGCQQIYLNNDETLLCLFSDVITAIKEITKGHYSYNDKYIVCDGLGVYESFGELEGEFETSDVVNWLIDCNGKSSVIDIEDYEEIEEEEELTI